VGFLFKVNVMQKNTSNFMKDISYSDGRVVKNAVVVIWPDLHTEARGNWYRAFWCASPDADTGSPVFGYASGQGGPHRTGREVAREVQRYYPGEKVFYSNGREVV
jgi:hypothetical protein